VRAQIVHDDDVAGPQDWHELLLDIGADPQRRLVSRHCRLELLQGKGFELREALAALEGNNVVAAKVPIYAGKNIISRKTPEQIATLVLTARGSSGRCRDYVTSIAEKLQALGIQDPAVSELCARIRAEP